MRGFLVLMLSGFGLGSFFRRLWRPGPNEADAGADPSEELRRKLAEARAAAADAEVAEVPGSTVVDAPVVRPSIVYEPVEVPVAEPVVVEETAPEAVEAEPVSAEAARVPGGVEVSEDLAAPAQAGDDPEARRRALHERARATIDELRKPDA